MVDYGEPQLQNIIVTAKKLIRTHKIKKRIEKKARHSLESRAYQFISQESQILARNLTYKQTAKGSVDHWLIAYHAEQQSNL